MPAGIATPPAVLTAKRVFVIAGEPSGDRLAAAAMAALSREGSYIFSGVGGEQMMEQGLVSLFPPQDIGLVGIQEVVMALPRILRRISEVERRIIADRPDLVLSVDVPDFSLRVARRIRRRGVPVPWAHMVAPTVWAWRPGRARLFAQRIDHLLALFPFEPPYFLREGLDCTYIGHPALEEGFEAGFALRVRSRLGVPADVPILCVLPGSRSRELATLLPIFAEVVRRLVFNAPNMVVVIPTLARLRDRLAEATASWPLPVHLVTTHEDKIDTFAAAQAALAASGTVVLETALAGLPTVVGYRVHPLTAWIARRLLTTPFAALPNIIAERAIVPEFLQQDCEPVRLHAALLLLLRNSDTNNAMREDLRAVRRRLTPAQPDLGAGAKAAAVLRSMLKE